MENLRSTTSSVPVCSPLARKAGMETNVRKSATAIFRNSLRDGAMPSAPCLLAHQSSRHKGWWTAVIVAASASLRQSTNVAQVPYYCANGAVASVTPISADVGEVLRIPQKGIAMSELRDRMVQDMRLAGLFAAKGDSPRERLRSGSRWHRAQFRQPKNKTFRIAIATRKASCENYQADVAKPASSDATSSWRVPC